MNLADELFLRPCVTVRGRLVQLEEPPLRLPFNGELSPDERRMLEQGIFDGPFSWE